MAATGTPIALGAIATNQPGTSFTDIPNMANAYFACVNANGGINGHPIKLYIETEQTNPAQIAANAKQLVETDHVVGIIGNTSIIECSVDSSYWQKLGYFIIDSGIAPECYSTPNSAAVNMGPRYSSDGAVQYALAQHVTKIVFDQSNVPGTGYIAAGPAALAKAANVPIVQLTENVPISDADSVAIKEVDDAGRTAPWCSTSPRPRRWSSCRRRRSSAWRTMSSCGAARPRATPTSWPRRWGRSGTASCSSTPS